MIDRINQEESMKKLLWLIPLFLVSCGGSVIKDAAEGIADPTERGLMYIAIALVIAAFIRGIFNK